MSTAPPIIISLPFGTIMLFCLMNQFRVKYVLALKQCSFISDFNVFCPKILTNIQIKIKTGTMAGLKK
jgi:hypothetical protein